MSADSIQTAYIYRSEAEYELRHVKKDSERYNKLIKLIEIFNEEIQDFLIEGCPDASDQFISSLYED